MESLEFGVPQGVIRLRTSDSGEQVIKCSKAEIAA